MKKYIMMKNEDIVTYSGWLIEYVFARVSHSDVKFMGGDYLVSSQGDLLRFVVVSVLVLVPLYYIYTPKKHVLPNLVPVLLIYTNSIISIANLRHHDKASKSEY